MREANYAAGGPRSVWEEKPALTKITEARCRMASVTASGGSLENEESAVPFCGWPCMQQSMGHCGASLPALMDRSSEDDAGVDAASIPAQWWCLVAAAVLPAWPGVRWQVMGWLTSAPCACASNGENSDTTIAIIAQIEASLRIRNPSI